MSVHILRNYASVSFKKHLSEGGFSQPQRRLIVEFIEENIGRNITLAELAGVLQLSVFHFSRRFRREFGCPPYAYVMRKRMEHAKRQLRCGNAPLKVVAADCGFADQSHMTRLFRRFLNMTPAGESRRVSPWWAMPEQQECPIILSRTFYIRAYFTSYRSPSPSHGGRGGRAIRR